MRITIYTQTSFPAFEWEMKELTDQGINLKHAEYFVIAPAYVINNKSRIDEKDDQLLDLLILNGMCELKPATFNGEQVAIGIKYN